MQIFFVTDLVWRPMRVVFFSERQTFGFPANIIQTIQIKLHSHVCSIWHKEQFAERNSEKPMQSPEPQRADVRPPWCPPPPPSWSHLLPWPWPQLSTQPSPKLSTWHSLPNGLLPTWLCLPTAILSLCFSPQVYISSVFNPLLCQSALAFIPSVVECSYFTHLNYKSYIYIHILHFKNHTKTQPKTIQSLDPQPTSRKLSEVKLGTCFTQTQGPSY